MSGPVTKTVTVDDTDSGFSWAIDQSSQYSSWEAVSGKDVSSITVNACDAVGGCLPTGRKFQQVDPTKLNNGTWHELVDDASVSYMFTGIGVDVYFAVINSAGRWTNVTFAIDGNHVGNLAYSGTGTSDFLYKYHAFGTSSLDNGQHLLSIQGGSPNLVIMDYLTYTELDAVPSSTVESSALLTSSMGGVTSSTQVPASTTSASSSSNHSKVPLIAGVVGGAFALILAAALIVWLVLRRRRASRETTDLLESDYPSPTPWGLDSAPQVSTALLGSNEHLHSSPRMPEKATYRRSDEALPPPQYSELPYSSSTTIVGTSRQI